MREIVFGIALGTILGALLYKKSEHAKDLFDQGEKIIKKEIEKMDKNSKKKSEN